LLWKSIKQGEARRVKWLKRNEFIHVYDKTLWDIHHRVSASADIIKLVVTGQLKGSVEYGPKWLLIKYEILPLIYKHTQGKLEGECSNLSEVT